MATPLSSPSTTRQRRRYVKVPETAHVKQLRDVWLHESADLDPMTMLLGAMLASHHLTVGRFGGVHWYASITNDNAAGLGMPDGLSGWGETPAKALSELAFRWHILLNAAWHPSRWNLKALPVWTVEGEVTC